MAFALSIKSIQDFDEKGKIFLVLTLIIALFTLLYSTFFLNCTLEKCGITNYCDADNFDANILSKNPNCFDRFKVKIMNFNDNYMKKCIKIPEDLNSSVNSSAGDMQLYRKNEGPKIAEVPSNEMQSFEGIKSEKLERRKSFDMETEANFNTNLSKDNLN